VSTDQTKNLGGRPPIGGWVSVAIGDDRLARVAAYAKQRGISRNEAVRRLLDAALTSTD
jgi:hypothetical protein